MEQITLQDIWSRKLNPIVVGLMKRTWTLSSWNKKVFRYRMAHGEIDSCVREITHDGNVPRSNDEMLDVARCFYEARVFFDDEWEEYFVPAINRMIAYNNNFVRWMPGYVIQNKQTGRKCIVEYDYALGFGVRNFTSLSVVNIESDGTLGSSWAWADYNDYVLVDKEHTAENIARIREKYKAEDRLPPYFLRNAIIQMYYGEPATSIRSGNNL